MERYEESLAIHRQLASNLGTPQIHCDVSFTLELNTKAVRERGDHDLADRWQLEFDAWQELS